MMFEKWKCCKTQPPETGKKVLCHRKGDLYVAMRLKNYYIPTPFADHYFCADLCFPETWCEIDFPENLTGKIRVMLEDTNKLIYLSEMEVGFPEEFNEFANMIIKDLGTLKRNKK